MKKIALVLLAVVLAMGCTAYNRAIKMKKEMGCGTRVTCFPQTPEQTEQINKNWLSLREGMTTEEVIALIGKPQRIHSLFSSSVTWTYTSHSLAMDIFVFAGTQLNLEFNPKTDRLKKYRRAWK